MKSHLLQSNFAQGEISRLMDGRYGLDMYEAGLSKLLNMITDPRGPVKARFGSRSLLELDGLNARNLTISRNDGNFATVIFTDLTMTVIKDSATPIPETIVSPYTEDQLDDLYFVRYAPDNFIYVLHPTVQTHKIIFNDGLNNSQEILVDTIFSVPAGINSISACYSGGGGGANVTRGGGGGGGAKKETIPVTPGEDITITIGQGGLGVTGGNPASDGGNTSLVYSGGTITAQGGAGKGTGNIAAPGREGGGAGGLGDGVFPPTDGGSTTATCDGSTILGGIGSQPLGGGGGGAGGFGVGADGVSGLGINGNNAADNTGGGGGQPDPASVNPTVGGNGGSGKVDLEWVSAGSAYTLVPVVFVNAPPTWSANNWPRCGTIFQNRMWVGGAPDDPEEFWGSKSGFPEDFDVGAAAPEDAMQHTVQSLGVINWITATKNLIIGSLSKEFVVTAEQGVLIPGDVQIEEQSSYTSANVEPLLIGDQLMYVNVSKNKLRAMNYEVLKDNWNSTDLSLPSEHLFRAGIKDIVWAQDPDNLLWVLLKDGTLACMTFERGSGVFGWHHHDTKGKIVSIDVGFSGTRSVLVMAIIRKGKVYIETLSEQYYMDSYLETSVVFVKPLSGGGAGGSGGAPSVPGGAGLLAGQILPGQESQNSDLINEYYVQGYDHLEGLTVQLLTDGAVHDDRVVGAESEVGAGDGAVGRIYINVVANSVVAGLGYTKELITNDLDGGAPTGSAAGMKKRRNKVIVKVLESAPPVINGEQYKDIYATDNMDTVPALLTGQLSMPDLEWDDAARVSVKQDGPLPLTVTAILGEVSKNAF